jgi:hypothetical protein
MPEEQSGRFPAPWRADETPGGYANHTPGPPMTLGNMRELGPLKVDL